MKGIMKGMNITASHARPLSFFHLQFRVPCVSRRVNYRQFIKHIWYYLIELNYGWRRDSVISRCNNILRDGETLTMQNIYVVIRLSRHVKIKSIDILCRYNVSLMFPTFVKSSAQDIVDR